MTDLKRLKKWLDEPWPWESNPPHPDAYEGGFSHTDDLILGPLTAIAAQSFVLTTFSVIAIFGIYYAMGYPSQWYTFILTRPFLTRFLFYMLSGIFVVILVAFDFLIYEFVKED